MGRGVGVIGAILESAEGLVLAGRPEPEKIIPLLGVALKRQAGRV